MNYPAAQPNKSFNPTLASESFIIKLAGFWYVVAVALASVGLIRALACFFCLKVKILMIQYLKTAVDILLKGLNLHLDVISKRNRNKLLLDLLTFYHCLSRLVENGDDLLSLTAKKSLEQVMLLPAEERSSFASRVYQVLLTQRLLLRKLSDLIYKQPIFDLFDSNLKSRLEELIGSKEKGLLSIAADLEMYLIFGMHPSRLLDTPEKELAHFRHQAGIVRDVFSEDSEIIDVKLAKKDLKKLRDANEKLRLKINELFTLDEQLKYVKKAKKIASFI